MMRRHKVVLVAVALCLLVGLVVQPQEWKRAPGKSKGEHLRRSLPSEVSGKPARDIPLGSTATGDELIVRVLQCDDVINRIYSCAIGEFHVYAAYWAPNKTPTQLVASHTPDRCWSENGWQCEDMRFQQRYNTGEHSLLPGEWRIFSGPGKHQRLEVLYWHVVNGRAYDYGRSFNWTPNPIQYWKQYALHLAIGSGEQYFVRISSETSFDVLWKDPGFQEVLSALAKLGLAAD